MPTATSLTEQNRAIVEAMFAAANNGDVEGVFSYLSDDVTVIEPLFMPFGKAYHGKDEFMGLAQVLPNYLDVPRSRCTTPSPTATASRRASASPTSRPEN